MVSSTAMPNAIAKVIAVGGLSRISKYPIIAAIASIGMVFGIMEINVTVKDLNNMAIKMVIRTKAVMKLVVKSLTKLSFVARARNVVPVISTFI